MKTLQELYGEPGVEVSREEYDSVLSLF